MNPTPLCSPPHNAVSYPLFATWPLITFCCESALPSVTEECKNVAVAENKAFRLSCTRCSATLCNMAFRRRLLLTQKTGHLVRLALCSMNCTMFLPRAAGLQRQKIQTDAVPQKYIFISCQKTPSPMPLKVRGIFERSMSIHYDSIQRAVLKQGPEVGSDPVLERSRDSSVPLHLPNLRRLREAKPDRYMALLRCVRPDIKAALDSGSRQTPTKYSEVACPKTPSAKTLKVRGTFFGKIHEHPLRLDSASCPEARA